MAAQPTFDFTEVMSITAELPVLHSFSSTTPLAVAPPATAPLASIPVHPKALQIAAKCREAADRMQKDIDAKFASAHHMRSLPVTRKRTQDSQSIYNDGVRLTKFQTILNRLAERHELGTIPASLAKINSRAAVEREYWKIPELQQMFEQAEREETREEKLQRIERDAIASKIPGFFPTPHEQARQLVQWLGPLPSEVTALETSAGTGRLIDAFLEAYPNSTIHWFEVSYTLNQFLSEKYQSQSNVYFAGRDFMDIILGHYAVRYDVAILNPPFENGQDIDHVMRAFELLKPGGVLSAIMSAGCFYRNGRKYELFRDWLEQYQPIVQDLEAGAFKQSGTMVNSKMVRLVRSY